MRPATVRILSIATVVAVATFAVTGLLVPLAMAQDSPANPDDPPAEPVPQEPNTGAEPNEVTDFLGDPPAPLAEPEVAPKQDSPEELLRSILDARDAKDHAALARCSSTSAGRADLTEVDASRAERDFLHEHVAKVWDRLRDAIATGDLTIDTETFQNPEGDPPIEARATARVPVPEGSAGEYQFVLVRIGGQWFLLVGP